MRAILAALAGALTLFLWGAAFWIGLSDFFGGLRKLEPAQEQAIVDTLNAQNLPTGVYYFPGMPTHGRDLPADEAERLNDEWEARHRAGPLGTITYVPEGKEVMEPVLFARGFAIDLIASILVCILVIAATPGGFLKRWGIAVLFGAAASVCIHLVDWNWMYTPTDYTLMACVDTTLGWAIAGIPIAALLPSSRRRKA
ncbi:MAG: hypothetical protein DYG94_09435 [Leptolyngbya sp. PLA3]|nr:MAG: hypothetical protein EDM82_11895 [Cyanobacteria bacterium CYA]MCE7968952.1 hypothetical protein [Leptolyngbya sp. PL-A3]